MVIALDPSPICYIESVFIAGRLFPMSMDIFEEAYHTTPAWDIGRAQREFIRLEESGKISCDVLDVGCGTGENALFLAGCGHEVWGVDSAPRAIGIARRKLKNEALLQRSW